MPKKLLDNDLNAVVGGTGAQQKTLGEQTKEKVLKKIKENPTIVVCAQCKLPYKNLKATDITVSGTTVNIHCSCTKTSPFNKSIFD